MSVDPSSRVWMQALARLRARTARLRGSARPETAELFVLLDQALDLTDALRAECAAYQKRMLEAEAEARRARDEASTLIDSLPAALVETDLAGRIVAVNRAAAALLGVSQAKLANDLLLHFTEDRGAFMHLVRELPRDTRPVWVSARLRPRDRAPFDATISVIRDPRSDEPRWMWTIEKISAPQSGARTPFAVAAQAGSSDLCGM